MRLSHAIRVALICLPCLATGLAHADGQLFVYGYDPQGLTDKYEVSLADGKVSKPAANGALALTLPAGESKLKVQVGTRWSAEIPVEITDKKQHSLLLTMRDDAVEYVLRDAQTNETLQTGKVANPDAVGQIVGRVTSADGNPVANAEVELTGTENVQSTDADGRYRFADLAPGTYSVMVDAEGLNTGLNEAAEVSAKSATESDFVLTVPGAAPAATDSGQTLGSVEVTGQQQGSQEQSKEEERVSSGVAEVVSAEELSKGGDTEVSGALKRVTGLSVVGGKFVYVRGLGERYSSVLLNGAQLPSPDPTRRVVPLDLFPTEVLDSVVIQKNYQASLPGEFGGGAVLLRTKEAPTKAFAKFSFGLSYLDGTSFSDGLRYDGGKRDWTGFDRVRELPSGVSGFVANGRSLSAASAAQLESFGEEVAAVGFDQRSENVGPNGSFSSALGGVTELGSVKLSGLWATRYANSWSSVTELRRRYATSNAVPLFLVGEFIRDRTERNIDFSNFVNLDAEFAPGQRLQFNSVWVRQTVDQTQAELGYDDSPDTISRVFENEWAENEMLANQLLGQHYFANLNELAIDWQVTKAEAERDAPARRRYRYERQGAGFVFSRQTDGNEITYENLQDDSTQYKLGLSIPYYFGEASQVSFSGGFDRMERERTSDIRRFIFTPQSAAVTTPAILRLPLNQILVPANIGPGGFNLRETTRAIDNYDADQEINAFYLSADLNYEELWRVALGFRYEDNTQDVRTFDLNNPVLGLIRGAIDGSDVLPSLSVTRTLNDTSQLRFAYSSTLSRPDFRELSPAPFFDPTLDVESSGNPDLEVTKLDNYDLRYEFYYTPEESVSAALFYKDFSDPIERTVKPGTGGLLTYENALSATNYGLELEGFKRLDFIGERWADYAIGANVAFIKSDVELGAAGAIQTNRNRPLQGQSEYLANLEFGYKPLERNDLEWTLLYNVFGDRIAQVGILGFPDIKELPFHQVDFTLKWRFADQWSLGVKLKNLLNQEVEFAQGGLPIRVFEPGREIGFSVEWRPFEEGQE